MTTIRPRPEIRRRNQVLQQSALDLSISSNLYLTDEQGIWFESVMEDRDYQKGVSEFLCSGEDALLELLAKTTIRSRNRKVTVIDCGPANAKESIRRLTKLMRAVSVAQYIAIDMNDHLLSKIKAHVSNALGIPSQFIQSRFEELSQGSFQRARSEQELLLFGSTGMNYENDELAKVFRKFCTPGMLIASESLIRTGSGSVVGYESRAVRRFAFGPLWLLGASEEDFDFHPVFAGDRILLEFLAKVPVNFAIAGYPALERGDAVCTAFSRRPTFDEHKKSFAEIAEPIGTITSCSRIATSLGRFR